MPQTGQIYPQHHGQHGQQIEGYDEDWDDDVYYAASGASGVGGSFGRATTSERSRGDDSRMSESVTRGRDHTSPKKHYMKVPNVRHLRAMRSTAASLSTGMLHASEPLSSPRTSPDTALGDMVTPSSTSGESSLPLIDQLTPSPSVPLVSREGLGEVAGGADCDTNLSKFAQRSVTANPRADSALPPPDPDDGFTAVDEGAVCRGPKINRKIDGPRQVQHGAETAGRLRPSAGKGCLVALRESSPRSARNIERDLKGKSSFSHESPRNPNRPKGFPVLDVEERIKKKRLMQIASAASEEGREDLIMGKSKRRRPPHGAEVGDDQRLCLGAWPKLPGGDSPLTKKSRRSLEMDAHGMEDARDIDDVDVDDVPGPVKSRSSGNAGSASVGRGMEVTPVTHVPSKKVIGETPCKPHRERGIPSSSVYSSSLSSTHDRDHGGRGAMGALQNRKREVPMRGPSIMDRPARWASKGGVSSSRSPLRPPGAKARPPLPRRGSSGGNPSPNTSTSEAKEQQLRQGFKGRVVCGRMGATRQTVVEENEGRTLKLASVFQAPSGSSSRLRAKRGRGRDSSPGQRGGSQRQPVWGGQVDASKAQSFDPSRIGLISISTSTSISCGATKTEEVEEVASDDEDYSVGGVGARGVEDGVVNGGPWTNGRRTGRGVELWGGAVDEFEDQPLGEDGSGGVDGARSGAGKSLRQMGRSGGRACENGVEGEGAGSQCNGRLVSGRLDALAHDDSALAVDVPSRASGLEGRESRASAPSSPTKDDQGAKSAAPLAGGTSHGKYLSKKQQQESGLGDPNPPPCTPVPSRPRSFTFTPSSFKRGSSCSISASTSGGQKKWRPSFGSEGDGSSSRSPGSMRAPWSVFSTPSRVSGDGSMVSGSGSTRKRSGGAGTGYLGKLLQQVRSRVDGDEARLLSGEFPFRQTWAGPAGGHPTEERGKYTDRGGGCVIGRRDHGDPRTRCKVALDVTVEHGGGDDGKNCDARSAATFRGIENGDRTSGTAGLVLLPCFVHGVVNVSIHAFDSAFDSTGGRAAIGAERDGGLFARLRVLEGTRVDALFKQDTRRALDVCGGSQLRIYDPCCVFPGEAEGGRGGRALLMCTQLCEPFPACFPPLADPPDA